MIVGEFVRQEFEPKARSGAQPECNQLADRWTMFILSSRGWKRESDERAHEVGNLRFD